MSRRPHFARRTRLRIALLALCALLFQQVALAAHACPLPSAIAATATMTAMPGCAGMPATGAHGARLCARHCAQQTPAPQDVRSPTVPALALPPQPPVLAFVTPPAAARFDPGAARDRAAAPPPRSCVLLI